MYKNQHKITPDILTHHKGIFKFLEIGKYTLIYLTFKKKYYLCFMVEI